MSTNVADTLLTEAISAPWAITEAGLSLILAVLTRTNVSLEALEKDRGEPLSNDRNSQVTYRDGVAIVTIAGPLVRRGDFFSRISGATSYDRVAADLAIALESPAVRAILLNIDSPGGEVTGVSDLAAMIRAGIAKKPIVAHTDGIAASAAYWIAAAASEIVASPTGLVGSIGVRMAMTKQKVSATDRYAQFEFVSSQSPKKSADPETDAGRAQIQQTIDDLAAVFVGTVATYRGVSVETVLADFGQGDVFVGQRALDAGMVDRLGSFEDTLAALARRSTTSTMRVGVPRAMAAAPSLLNPGAQMDQKDNEAGATVTGEPTAAQLEAHASKAVAVALASDRTRMTQICAVAGVTLDASVVTAITSGVDAGAFALSRVLDQQAAAAKAGADHLERAAKNEKDLQALNITVPGAKAADDTTPPAAAKKGALVAAAKRTGLLKATTGGTD